jgi:hypothetical protein
MQNEPFLFFLHSGYVTNALPDKQTLHTREFLGRYLMKTPDILIRAMSLLAPSIVNN